MESNNSGIITISSDTKSNDPVSIDIEPISESGPSRSVNFGIGAELLMNDKKRNENASKSPDIGLADLETIETELSELSSKPSLREAQSNLFSLNTSNVEESGKESSKSISIEPVNISSPKPGIAQASNNAKEESQKTWDSYNTFNEIPLNPETPSEPKLTPEETLKEKFKYLRKLEDLEKKGVQLTKSYTMESSLSEMKGEY